MQAKGHKVPALDSRPQFPSYLQVLLTIHRDLMQDGTIMYRDYCLWCDRHDVVGEQFNYLWQVILVALAKVYEWKKKELSSKSSVRTTESTPVRAER